MYFVTVFALLLKAMKALRKLRRLVLFRLCFTVLVGSVLASVAYQYWFPSFLLQTTET